MKLIHSITEIFQLHIMDEEKREVRKQHKKRGSWVVLQKAKHIPRYLLQKTGDTDSSRCSYAGVPCCAAQSPAVEMVPVPISR